MDDNSYACSNGVTKGEKLSVTWSGENIVIQDGDETKELVYQNGYYISVFLSSPAEPVPGTAPPL